MRKIGYIWWCILFPYCLFGQSSYQLTPPLYAVDSLIFQQSAQVSLIFGMASAQIEYRRHDENGDPGEINHYTQPFEVRESMVITAHATAPGYEPSDWLRIVLLKATQTIDSILISSEFPSTYPGKGPQGLYDLQKGTEDFKHGQWMGFNTPMVELEVYPGKGKVRRVIFSFLDDPRSWILVPETIRFKGWRGGQWVAVKGKWAWDEKEEFSPQNRMVVFEIKQRKMRRLEKYKIEMEQPVLPETHPGAGTGAWIFTDEILIK